MTDTERERIKAICEVAGVSEIDDLSDGFHTFRQLYYQCMMLFAAIVKQNRDKTWKSLRHEDGDLCFGGGWFIVGVDTPEGSYTYHYESNFYSLFECEELERGKHWDGHTEKDVTRLLSLPSAQPDAPDTNVGDIISRQAAIDEIEERKNANGYRNVAVISELNRLEGYIMRLPSAQPEQRWISSGKKPLKEGSYLVWMPFAPPKHRMAVAEYCGGYWNIKTPISAWMPLPESCKERLEE